MVDVEPVVALHSAALLDDQPGPAALLDTSGRVVMVSRTWSSQPGQGVTTAAEVIGRDYAVTLARLGRFGTAAIAEIATVLDQVRHGDHDSVVITIRCDDDPQPRWEDVAMRSLRRRSDGGCGGVLVVHRDATADHDAYEAISATGDWAQAVVLGFADMITITEPDGTVRWVSPSVEQMLGWRPDELIGLNSFTLIHPDDLAGMAAKRASDAGRAGQAHPAVFRLRTGSGGYRYVESRTTNLVDDPAVAGMVVYARDVTEQVAAETRLRHLAGTDPLTGLANRATLLTELGGRLAGSKPTGVTVAFIDLDRFRLVNDALGHRAGDDLLVETARRLAGRLTPGEVLARLGGDEFVVLTSSVDLPQVVVDRLLAAFDDPFRVAGTTTTITASVGIASIPAGPGGVDPDDLLDRADAAMYAAKRDASVRWRAYDTSLRADAAFQSRLTEQIRGGLAAAEFRPAYQPVYDLASGQLIGVEALARWHRSDGTVWLPGSFIPACESSGLICALGGSMLEQACADVSAWDAGTPWVAVNVSAPQLMDSRFPGQVADVLSRHGLAAERLKIELTESYVIDDQLAPQTLGRVRRLGVGLTIDDFGTGWSSLSRLAELPVSAIKIDRRFVAAIHRPTARAIVTAITALGDALGLFTVAEGVETPAQLADVRRLGADAVQGYLTGRPTALDTVAPVAEQIRSGDGDLSEGPAAQ